LEVQNNAAHGCNSGNENEFNCLPWVGIRAAPERP
jgi:hypothetical protein